MITKVKNCTISCIRAGLGNCTYPSTCVDYIVKCDVCGKEVDVLYEWEGVVACRECHQKDIMLRKPSELFDIFLGYNEIIDCTEQEIANCC